VETVPMAEPDINDETETWQEFRDDDANPVRVVGLARIDFQKMPEDIVIRVLDDYFPDTSIWREGESLICEIEEHLYTKHWEHKFSAYAFAEAMERAVRRLSNEGHPISDPTRDDDDVHIFVRWKLTLALATPHDKLAESIKSSFDLVWSRADSILENSDSVLVLGKDNGPALDRLKRIASSLEDLGYYTYIIKEQPDKLGESVIQKVMRFALSSKFVIVENTEPSGHLYEFPHIAKAAECVTVVLQEEGAGATWMFEDAYAKHRHWHRLYYKNAELENAVAAAATWAEEFIAKFTDYQVAKLPWLKP
jgi:hypothetical protein